MTLTENTATRAGYPSRVRPKVSVVLNTYNRAAHVRGAVDSVLLQSGADLELVVVDDGSTDDTQVVIAELVDARLRYVRQSNRGLSAARNLGAREARGEWLLFLDDDDRLCEGALEALLAAESDPATLVVIGGIRFVDSDGQVLQERLPASLDHALAGTFLISRSLFHESGGYLEGLPCSHQTELFLRVRQVLGDHPDAVAFVARPVVEIERRNAAGRPQRSPANAYFGGRWIAARHPNQHSSSRTRATLETIAAVNAMRMGREADARRRFASAIRLDPLSPGRYLRLAGAVVAPIGRRFWLRQWQIVPQRQRPLDRLRRADGYDDSTGGMAPLERDPYPGPDSLFLPWRYRQNPASSPHGIGSLSWREGPTSDLRRNAPTYKLAARLVRSKRLTPVIDIGYVAEGHQDDESVWYHISRLKPQLVICSDVAQRVPDPRRLLSGIRHAVGDGGLALIITPNRNRLDPETALGPPRNPNHLREWTAEEFSLLLESCGFEILRVVHRLPRQPVSNQRSAVGFLVQPAR